MSIHCYAAMARCAPLETFQYEPKPLEADEVEVKISHCGICHSDIHLIDNDWNNSIYPLVPGHEIIGEIIAKGSEVRHLNLGQRVGVGWLCGACLKCEACRKGDFHQCEKAVATPVGHYGGFAERVRCQAELAYPIPEILPSAQAAPLLCAGSTVYNPFRLYDVKAGMRVGIIGIGGLGHLALQYANAWGCEVTAFSGTRTKEEEAKKFGAHQFMMSHDRRQMEAFKNQFDFILSTVSGDLVWSDYLNLLKYRGKLCVVGASQEINFPFMPVLLKELIIGSARTGNCHLMKEMLEFSAKHQIKAQVQVAAFQDVNQAIQKVRSNQARYRMVLEML